METHVAALSVRETAGALRWAGLPAAWLRLSQKTRAAAAYAPSVTPRPFTCVSNRLTLKLTGTEIKAALQNVLGDMRKTPPPPTKKTL